MKVGDFFFLLDYLGPFVQLRSSILSPYELHEYIHLELESQRVSVFQVSLPYLFFEHYKTRS